MAIFSSLPNVLLIIFGFGMLIFIHELGHFLAAKWANIRTEAFAIGMGPVMCSWRKGIGFRPGSTRKALDDAVKRFLADEVHRKPGQSVEQAFEALSETEYRRITDKLGIGETEYSLRWFPIGGFVKMLGQEDANPNAVSDDPRSFNVCTIPKRMVVVSAGVVANVLLALALFVLTFMVGVNFEAPVVGMVAQTMPAGTTMPENAEALGVTAPGLQPGDVVTHINGDEARTFADIRLAAAMGKPGAVVRFTVNREGIDEPLRFDITPQHDKLSGLLGIGVAPGSSTTLLAKDDPVLDLNTMLEESGLAEAGVGLGMCLVSASGEPVTTYEQFNARVAESNGRPVSTEWQALNEDGTPFGAAIAVDVSVMPEFQVLRYPELADDGVREFENGLFGLVPLTRISRLLDGSANTELLQPGDVILHAGSLAAPRLKELNDEVRRHAGGTIELTVLRDGVEEQISARVSPSGMVGIALGYALDVPIVAEPMQRIAIPQNGGKEAVAADSPLAALNLKAGTRLEAVNGTPVAEWRSLRAALREHTAAAALEGTSAEIQLTIAAPESESETVVLTLAEADVAALHALTWTSDLPAYAFAPVYTKLTAGGNPITAISMGMRETHKMIVMTYLTIDRLFRGSVGVEQLRGPIGIVHLGANVLDKGFMWFLFFLGMISVNLAVINFLPIPIVDGGLFLFLIYEKFRGRPPSIKFQNAATVVGLCLIGALLLITFYNDIARLIR